MEGTEGSMKWLRTDLYVMNPIVTMELNHLIPGLSRKRKGGGVAIYVRHDLNARVHNQPGLFSDEIELLWVECQFNGRSCFIGALYHPPKPIYSADAIQKALEDSLEEIFSQPGDALIILAGDFNQLPDHVVTSLGLVIEFNQPTHEGHCLDKIYASEHVFTVCRAFESTVKKRHRAVVARSDGNPIDVKKESHTHSFRSRTPALHANFMKYLRDCVDWVEVNECWDTQLAFDKFYEQFLAMLDKFYPTRLITITNRDPPFITPEIKVLLRRKNKLMKMNQIEAANAIAKQIHDKIQSRNAATFANPCKDTKELWNRVNRVTGKTKQAPKVSTPGISAELLNTHYAKISTDPNYVEPAKKLTCVDKGVPLIEEFQIFKMLDGLAATSSGTDGMPHWFIRIAAPSICSPITHLFNLSLTTSIVPTQWKTSAITPVPKTKQPTQCSDFRPISVTPILSRLLEKFVVSNYIYPILTASCYASPFPRSVCLQTNWVNYISNRSSHPPLV